MTRTSRVKEAPASLEVQPVEIGDPHISVPRSLRIAQHEPGSRAWLDIPTEPSSATRASLDHTRASLDSTDRSPARRCTRFELTDHNPLSSGIL